MRHTVPTQALTHMTKFIYWLSVQARRAWAGRCAKAVKQELRQWVPSSYAKKACHVLPMKIITLTYTQVSSVKHCKGVVPFRNVHGRRRALQPGPRLHVQLLCGSQVSVQSFEKTIAYGMCWELCGNKARTDWSCNDALPVQAARACRQRCCDKYGHGLIDHLFQFAPPPACRRRHPGHGAHGPEKVPVAMQECTAECSASYKALTGWYPA